jgi:hypothetical protein
VFLVRQKAKSAGFCHPQSQQGVRKCESQDFQQHGHSLFYFGVSDEDGAIFSSPAFLQRSFHLWKTCHPSSHEASLNSILFPEMEVQPHPGHYHPDGRPSDMSPHVCSLEVTTHTSKQESSPCPGEAAVAKQPGVSSLNVKEQSVQGSVILLR